MEKIKLKKKKIEIKIKKEEMRSKGRRGKIGR
jgi:hypothetical protein